MISLNGVQSITGTNFTSSTGGDVSYRTAKPAGVVPPGINPSYKTPGNGGPVKTPGARETTPPNSNPPPDSTPPPTGNQKPPDGNAEPENEYKVVILWGDTSGSESESYSVSVTGEPTLPASTPGELNDKKLTLSRLKLYEFSLNHVSTNLEDGEEPDYDYQLTIDPLYAGPDRTIPPRAVVLDEEDLLGTFFDDPTFKGKKAQVFSLQFKAQPGKLNDGFDDTGQEVWTSVSKDWSQYSTNTKVRLVMPSAAAQLCKIEVPTADAPYIDVTPAQPSGASTNLTINGKTESQGDLKDISNVAVEIRSRTSGKFIDKLNVKALPQRNTVDLRYYRAWDSLSTSPIGTMPTSPEPNLGLVGGEIDNRFSQQAGINMALTGAAGQPPPLVDVRDDVNYADNGALDTHDHNDAFIFDELNAFRVAHRADAFPGVPHGFR